MAEVSHGAAHLDYVISHHESEEAKEKRYLLPRHMTLPVEIMSLQAALAQGVPLEAVTHRAVWLTGL